MPFLIAIIITFIIVNKTSNNKRKGKQGEIKVSNILNQLPSDYVTLNDIMVYNNKNKTRTTQIDHIVISKKGIFIIETKNYSGWVFGDEHSKYWTQAFYKRKFKFYNPIIQNQIHLNAVKNILKNKYPSISCYSIIVFSDKCTLKEISSITPVIYMSELKKYICKIKSKNLLDKSDILDIVKIIQNHNIKSKFAKKKHIKNIKRYYK